MALILPRKALSAYDKRLAELEGKAYEYASSRISAFIEKFPGAKPEQVREFAIEVVDDAVGRSATGPRRSLRTCTRVWPSSPALGLNPPS